MEEISIPNLRNNWKRKNKTCKMLEVVFFSNKIHHNKMLGSINNFLALHQGCLTTINSVVIFAYNSLFHQTIVCSRL